MTQVNKFCFILCSLWIKGHNSGSQEDLPDEEYNRKSVLLMLLSMILCCSPVCEKQALFAMFQCVKENGLEPLLVRKVSAFGGFVTKKATESARLFHSFQRIYS